MKRMIAAVAALTLTAACFTSCGDNEKKDNSSSKTETTTAADTTAEDTTTEAATEADTTKAVEEDEDENYDTGDASLDNARNQDR